ncbi:hypothetical protein [Gordonia sp. (in: high G+C Gram-positive bacteria)]|uniref:hypothetical protein n=1 Tax=Gordonia sp. (in: high G+C Gram-positive bacteria) TaxID=84139 RepID=UPI00333F4C5E
MSKPTRNNPADVTPTDISDLLNLADRAADPVATVNSMFADRDDDEDLIHSINKITREPLCGVEIELESMPPGLVVGGGTGSKRCPVCDQFRHMWRELKWSSQHTVHYFDGAP